MTGNLRESILAADDLQYEDVTVAQWGGRRIRIREMDGPERYEADTVTEGLTEWETICYFVRISLYDPDTGDRLFTEEDKAAFEAKSPRVILFLWGYVKGLSGLGDAVEDEMEKSEPNVTESTGTD